jgi:hypothetical protein
MHHVIYFNIPGAPGNGYNGSTVVRRDAPIPRNGEFVIFPAITGLFVVTNTTYTYGAENIVEIDLQFRK